MGRVSNCHLEGFQFESGKSRIILFKQNDIII